VHKGVSFRITGMFCLSLDGRVERVLRATDGVSGVSVYLATETVRLEVEHAATLPVAVATIRLQVAR
jgi:cation transport ATPase